MPWQPSALVAPDVELWGCQTLRSALAGRTESYATHVYVGVRIPDPRRDRMVILRRDGGLQGEVRDQPRLAVQVYAMTEQDATDLARLVLALLWAAPDGKPVLSVSVSSGPSQVDDPSGQQLRYMVLNIATRLSLLES
jgi:hypothetical protein